MLSRKQASYITVADYLKGEQHADSKHEYINGDVYAMAGGSRKHNTLAFNLATLIGAQLQAPCQGYGPDMKIRIRHQEQDVFYYPDLSVSRREETGDDYYNEHPVLIVEVLSPSTERLDKHEKFLVYRSLPSLQEYLLVHQDIPEIWLFRRRQQWDRDVFSEGEFRLESVNVTLTVEEVYRNVDF